MHLSQGCRQIQVPAVCVRDVAPHKYTTCAHILSRFATMRTSSCASCLSPRYKQIYVSAVCVHNVGQAVCVLDVRKLISQLLLAMTWADLSKFMFQLFVYMMSACLCLTSLRSRCGQVYVPAVFVWCAEAFDSCFRLRFFFTTSFISKWRTCFFINILAYVMKIWLHFFKVLPTSF